MTTPELLTWDNLSESGITNLPSLEHNPLLAAYLCDAATCTANWTVGRRMLEHAILAQGISHRTEYTDYSYIDSATNQIARVLRDELAQSCVEAHMVCHHLLGYHDVCPSESTPGRIAYFQDDRKRAQGIRTPIKVRKYLQKFFKDFRSEEELERVACLLDEIMHDTGKYDVRIYDDAAIGGWTDAYYHINSCMNTRDNNYGVGRHKTYRCYCTAAMTGGAKSSGLSLVILYQDGKPVARSITYEGSSGAKYYVRNYGDDRLVKWLDDNGYEHQPWLPHGTRLWTECHEVDNDYLSPYVDGNDIDARATLELVEGQAYWVISDGGVELQNPCGYTRGIPLMCDCCDESVREGDEREQPALDGNYVTLCSYCAHHHCYSVDGETNIYVSDGDLGDLIATNRHNYYTQEYLDNHEVVVTGDGDVMGWSDVDLCERSDQYYSRDEFEDISLEPGYVQETWAGYINDNGRVHGYFYRKLGVYISELDTYVHGNHVDDVLAYLASERDSDSMSESEA